MHLNMNLIHNTTRTKHAAVRTYTNTLGLTQHYFTQPSEDTLHV